MDEEVKQIYIKAGEAVQEAREKAQSIVEPGVNLKTLAEEIEGLIREEGLQPAFPVNISIDDVAAHYSPGIDEERTLKESDVVKIDIGVHSEGYIADTALTLNPSGEHSDIIQANRDVLEEALKFIEPGVTVGELGTFIQNQVPDEYSVVRNLTGHSLGRYTQHAGLSIPNISNSSNYVFQEGDALAIEPFLTTGSGKIKNGKKGNIYIRQEGKVRGRSSRQLLKKVERFKGLPFSSRWLDMSGREKMALKKLVNSGAVKHYPVLKEVEGGTVTQAEHTVVLTEDGKIVTTRR